MRERFGIRLFAVLAMMAAASPSWGQASVLTCQATVNPIIVRSEGLTERMGDILVQCVGGLPYQGISGNLSVFLSVPMTNRLNGNGESDLILTVDNGFGPYAANVKARYITANTQSFSGLAFNLSSTGTVTLRMSNLRGAANQVGLNIVRQITASLSFTAGALITLSNNVFSVGTVLRSFYSSYTSSLVCSQQGTPPFDTTSLSSAINSRTAFATIRITEGFPSSLLARSETVMQTGDFGSRVIIKFAGVPQGASLYLPDVIVGYDGIQQTSAGDYGVFPADGVYSPGVGTLLLSRVINADQVGGGRGSGPMFQRPAGTTYYDTMSPVTITSDGTGQAVYEVIDSNAFAIQSATIPTFLSVTPGAVQDLALIQQSVQLGPVSNSLGTSVDQMIPRFVNVSADNDCQAFGDCGAPYFPKLNVDKTALDVTMTSLDIQRTQYFTISNQGAGNFLWKATIQYLSGPAGSYKWLKIPKTSGINRETVEVDMVPGNLPTGVYEALVSIDAGPIAGTAAVKVTMRLSYQAPLPLLINVVNAANQKPGAIVAGSKVSLLGDRLLGTSVSATFDGAPARTLNASSVSRVDVQAPYSILGKSSTLVQVIVDGSISNSVLIPVAASNPAIFANGILNFDNSANSANSPAQAGTLISILSSGLPLTGVYGAQVHDRYITGGDLLFAGAHPSLIGIQLIQLIVPIDLPDLATSTYVCGGDSNDTLVCSDAADIRISAAPSQQRVIQ